MEIALSVAGSVVGKLSEYLVTPMTECLIAPIGRQFSYLLHYNRNIKNLQEELQKLDDRRNGVELCVGEARRNLHVIGRDVVRWQEKVDDIDKQARRFLENEIKANNRCLNGCCPDVKSRYSFSRRAMKMTSEVAKLYQDGKFDKIAYPCSPPKIGSISSEGIKDFESRWSILNEVLEALKGDKISSIAICGMAGVGKTTMVKQVMKRVVAENVFHDVAMAVVTQNPDFMKIQGELADRLGLKFEEETLSGRAGRLRQRLMNSDKKILLVLDDVWEKLDFEAIGLPSGDENKRCKIVLTSRSENVCRVMESQRIFVVNALSYEEGWDLFREMAGISVDHPDLYPIAEKVANECGGLPIALVTVARALKDKVKNIWEDAFLQLRKSMARNIPGVQKDVYLQIELSYNFLESNEAKSCFLLCCLFPEDYNVPIDDLVRYGMGLRFFEGIDNIQEARNRVHALVDKLKSSFLLLDGDKYESVKMHDLVRDVAILIASTDEHAFLVSCDAAMKGWPKMDRYNRYTAISLVSDETTEYPDDFDCPKLELLQLSCHKYSHLQSRADKIFERMKELKVLTLKIPTLPQSLLVLKNLRTLCLEEFESGDISVIGAFVKLEILKIGTHSLKELPVETGQLTNLRLLDLRNCEFLRCIPPGILSKLSKLEELYITGSFLNWAYAKKEDREKITNASLGEIESSQLNALQVCLRQASLLPEKAILEKLTRFKISVGHAYHGDHYSGNFLRLRDDASEVMKSGIYVLLKKTEVLHLETSNLTNDLYQLDGECFPHLKELSVKNCQKLEYIVDATDQIPLTAFPSLEKLSLSELSSLKEIWNGELLMAPFDRQIMQISCFSNLQDLKVYHCDKLKYVFTLSMARRLQQLQSLNVTWCDNIEEIFLIKEGEDENIKGHEIEFPKLTDLVLYRIPMLLSFCVGVENKTAKLHSQLSNNHVAMKSSLNGKQVTTDKEFSASQMENTSDFKHKKVQAAASTMNMMPILFTMHCPQLLNLKKLTMWNCGLLKAVFSLSVTNQLLQLEELTIKQCMELEYVIVERQEGKNDETSIIIFPKLHFLELRELPNLKTFCGEDCILFEWPSLKQLALIKCPKLKPESLFGLEVPEPPTMGHSSTMLRNGNFIDKINEVNSGNVDDLVDARSAIPCKSVERLQNIEFVCFNGCDAGSMLFSLVKEEDNVNVASTHTLAFNCLKRVSLFDLPKLMHIWAKIPQQVTAFDNLQLLHVEQCHGLMYLLSPCVAKLLIKLKKLWIIDCERIEEIVTKLGGEELTADMRVFPHLNYLELRNLPKLKSLWPEPYIIQWPGLEVVEVNNCPRLKIFGFRDQQLLEPNTANVKLGLGKVALPSLKTLSLRDMEGLTRICQNQLPDGSLVDLRHLEVRKCNNLVNVVPWNFIEPLQNLENLSVTRCESSVEIFEYKEVKIDGDQNVVIFSHLEEISLSSLPKLIHIFNVPKTVVGFQNLREMQVGFCSSLKKIFSASIAKGLVQLRTLKITDCEVLEQVIAKDGEEEQQQQQQLQLQQARMNKILFPQLSLVRLCDLPNLRSFYGGSLALILPSLQELDFYKCPEMKTFSYGLLSTPKLEKVYIDQATYRVREDLNATIQYLLIEN